MEVVSASEHTDFCHQICLAHFFLRMQHSKEKMKLICHIRDESRELLPSMAPRSEAMHRLWKEPNLERYSRFTCQWSKRGMQQVHKKLLYTFFIVPLDLVGYNIVVVNCCLQKYVISTNLEITLMLHNSCCIFTEWEIECTPPFHFGY